METKINRKGLGCLANKYITKQENEKKITREVY